MMNLKFNFEMLHISLMFQLKLLSIFTFGRLISLRLLKLSFVTTALFLENQRKLKAF